MKKIALAGAFVGIFLLGSVAGAAGSNGIEKISAYINKKITIVLNGQVWQIKNSTGNRIYPISYNGTTYLPVSSVGQALGANISYANNTITIGSGSIAAVSNTTSSSTNLNQITLSSVSDIQKYLKQNYVSKSPLKTDLGNITFDISIKENKSKFEEYDYLISFNYDVKSIDQTILDKENSIDPADNQKAINTKNQLKSFIETYAKDIISKVPNKKIRGESDGSYYTYPNLKVDYNVYLRNVWVNFDFKDPNSYFADYYSPLAEYNDTVISSFKWAPEENK